MSVFKLPSIHELPTAPPDLQKEVLEALFEPSDEMYTNAAPLLSQQHPSYDALIDEVGELLRTLVTHQDASARAALLAILRSHPRLGAPKPQQLSELSRAEQANINRSAQQETAEQLAELNRVYEEKFGGLIYVVFVNGRGRDVIMEDMRRRIERGDFELEMLEAISAMCDIAKSRAHKLNAGGGPA